MARLKRSVFAAPAQEPADRDISTPADGALRPVKPPLALSWEKPGIPSPERKLAYLADRMTDAPAADRRSQLFREGPVEMIGRLAPAPKNVVEMPGVASSVSPSPPFSCSTMSSR